MAVSLEINFLFPVQEFITSFDANVLFKEVSQVLNSPEIPLGLRIFNI